MPCENNLLGDFDAKIIRIYIHSKQFTFFWVSNFDAIINIKLTNQHASLLKYPIDNHAKTIKSQSIEQFAAKKCGIINHFIPYIQIYFQKSAAKF